MIKISKSENEYQRYHLEGNIFPVPNNWFYKFLSELNGHDIAITNTILKNDFNVLASQVLSE